MNNLVTVVGRICEMHYKISDDKKKMFIKIEVPCDFKNEKGKYETEIIPCILYSQLAENVDCYCRLGDLIGIRGRITSRSSKIQVVAERVTFLTNRKK